MWTFKRTFQEAFDTGGILIFGLSCLFLFRQQYYPNVLGPLSFGMISVGAVGFVRHLIKDLGSRTENSKYQEILQLLEQRQSEIEANRCMLEELRDACSRFMAMREILEALQGDSSLIEERAAILTKILQPRDVVTSRESTQETPSDVQIEPLCENTPTESENTSVGTEMKSKAKQGQTERNPKSLKEQALQIRSNVIASLISHATENPQKEETEEHYLEKSDESKQEALENTLEKMLEKSMKQEDRVMKDMDKTDGVEYKPEETESLLKSVVQVEKEDLQSKELDELNKQEGRSEFKQGEIENLSKNDEREEKENLQSKESNELNMQEGRSEYNQGEIENLSKNDKQEKENLQSKESDELNKQEGRSEYNQGEIENLSKNDKQEEKENLQSKESDELNKQEGRSECKQGEIEILLKDDVQEEEKEDLQRKESDE